MAWLKDLARALLAMWGRQTLGFCFSANYKCGEQSWSACSQAELMNTITCSALGVTCWPMNFERIQPFLGVQTPLWTLVYLLPLCNGVLLQVKTLCLLPSVLDFIPKKKKWMGVLLPVLPHPEFPPWALSLAGQRSEKLFLWVTARCTRSIKKKKMHLWLIPSPDTD